MLFMFRKINAKERVVGFYSTGPSIRPNDLRIHEIVKRFLPATTTTPPIFCIIDIRPDRATMPTTAYKVVEEVSTRDGQRQVRLSFAHVPSQMGAMEAEEVGVEHLLRDINDPTISTVASLIKGKVAGLDTLGEKLKECQEYLAFAASATETAATASSSSQRKVNPQIVANLQTILNLLPNLNTDELVRSMLIKTNDMHMAIYLSALIRCVLALHDLINNKIQYGDNGMENNIQEEAAAAATPAATVEEEKKEDSGATDGKTTEKKDKL
jgi:26S proteasome regulatory subunit N8